MFVCFISNAKIVNISQIRKLFQGYYELISVFLWHKRTIKTKNGIVIIWLDIVWKMLI
ncbi:cobalt ABC superfamily ATP binding cassette transporter, membrane protein [Prevotella nigrescens ATCC 33563]|nr:cobalt ABC superfamily ATP binding cassette transporter, membrane protein [Prevotella nigrescens ATCC 33563]